jgi:hypothetical protein
MVQRENAKETESREAGFEVETQNPQEPKHKSVHLDEARLIALATSRGFGRG